MTVTYKSLYQMVVEEIGKRTTYSQSLRTSDQLTRDDISPLTGNAISDITTASLINSIQTLLASIVRPRIISGLHVKATTPESNQIIIESGSGVSYGRYYELLNETTLTVPFDNTTQVFYVTLFDNAVMIDKNDDPRKLTIAKIVVPAPGTTAYVIDNKDLNNAIDAYIVNQRDYYLHGDNADHFEEDTVELLRGNISPILADNLIGNIRLSEDLKIINTQGTMELDSNEMRLLNNDGDVMMKLNQNGSYFYDINGIEIAKFSTSGALVGNIAIYPNSIESTNFVSGALGSGFQILDSGDAEFNSVTVRGRLKTSVFEKDTISSVGGSLLIADSDILDLDMTALDNETLTISGDTTFDVGDMLRIKDGIDDEWMIVTGILSGNTYQVTRDAGNDYPPNSNPTWMKSTAVVNYGASDEGVIYMTASDSNAPHIDILNTGTTPWDSPITTMRMGNLNGFLGYNQDLYGTAIGDNDNYLKYDPLNGLRIKGSVQITGGTHIPVTYYQDDEPTGPTLYDGDYWVDTNDNNMLYVYNGAMWNQAGASGGITTFNQSGTASANGIPTSTAIGDLWVDTDTNLLYRAASVGANEIIVGEWELTQNGFGSTPDIDPGLYLGSDYLGYYDGTNWLAYIKNDGNFYLGGQPYSGGGSHYVCWNGDTFCIRGDLLADDLYAGCICLDRGISIQSEGGLGARTIFNTNGIYSYNSSGCERFSVIDGQIVAQDIRLQDPLCCCCYSFLTAGALRFHDEYGDVPYVKRLASGTANTGTTVYLQGWRTAPNLTVSVSTLYSYNSAYAAQSQQWAVYYDDVACYCNSPTDYGYRFHVHSELRLASGQGTEKICQILFGTPVCTEACTCSTRIRLKFLMYCNNAAPSNYWAGCLCYRLCYRVLGAGTYCCYADYNTLQPHSSETELKSFSEQTQIMNFPCMATWQILPVCLCICWHDTLICATTSSICTSATSQMASAICCATPTYGYCCYCEGGPWTFCLNCDVNPAWPSYSCTWTLYNSTCYGTLCYYAQIYGHGNSLGGSFQQTTCLATTPTYSCCACFCSSFCNYGCKLTFSATNMNCSCFDLRMYSTFGHPSFYTTMVVEYCYCFCLYNLCRCLYFCCTHYQGSPQMCQVMCTYGLCNTFGCYCIIDSQGTLNWLAIAYS